MKKILAYVVARILMPLGFGWPTIADFKSNADSALQKVILATKKGWLRWVKYSQTGERPYYTAISSPRICMTLESDGKVFGEVAHTVYSLRCQSVQGNIALECSRTDGKQGGPQFTGHRRLDELSGVVYHIFNP